MSGSAASGFAQSDRDFCRHIVSHVGVAAIPLSPFYSDAPASQVIRLCFAKSEKDNVKKDELAALKKLAAELLAYDDKTIVRVVTSGALVEVTCDEKTIP